MGNCVKSLFPSIKWSRRRTVELAILTVLAVTSSILILVLPSSRVYCVIVLCLVVIYGARLWRLLPSDRRRVSKEAHALADAVLRARQAVGTFPSLAQSMHPPQPQAHSMCTPQQPQSLFAGSVQAPPPSATSPLDVHPTAAAVAICGVCAGTILTYGRNASGTAAGGFNGPVSSSNHGSLDASTATKASTGDAGGFYEPTTAIVDRLSNARAASANDFIPITTAARDEFIPATATDDADSSFTTTAGNVGLQHLTITANARFLSSVVADGALFYGRRQRAAAAHTDCQECCEVWLALCRYYVLARPQPLSSLMLVLPCIL
ncbi:hypothetical protein DQ04_06381040 [Trypanosoma grayi]|uniref:hypothetical protein n=1 Tax=Trypanosoma grayi TaxID=71804 RepID=UPI0004F44BFE|nr:hypothetical protein DQ04_06381040 [Trypanosoma grayi]KEG08826.1 hypothetical protein DQ04_06381040 [Trypanosoma grayi]